MNQNPMLSYEFGVSIDSLSLSYSKQGLLNFFQKHQSPSTPEYVYGIAPSHISFFFLLLIPRELFNFIPTLPSLLTYNQHERKNFINLWRVFWNPSFRRDLISPDTFQGKEMPIAMKKEEEDALKRSSSAMSLKKLVPKVLRSNSMKNLFKSKKPRTPVDIVRETRKLLLYIDSGADDGNPKRNEKVDLFCIAPSFEFMFLLVCFTYIGYSLLLLFKKKKKILLLFSFDFLLHFRNEFPRGRDRARSLCWKMQQ